LNSPPSVSPEYRDLLFDPQTSGGLLIAGGRAIRHHSTLRICSDTEFPPRKRGARRHRKKASPLLFVRLRKCQQASVPKVQLRVAQKKLMKALRNLRRPRSTLQNNKSWTTITHGNCGCAARAKALFGGDEMFSTRPMETRDAVITWSLMTGSDFFSGHIDVLRDIFSHSDLLIITWPSQHHALAAVLADFSLCCWQALTRESSVTVSKWEAPPFAMLTGNLRPVGILSHILLGPGHYLRHDDLVAAGNIRVQAWDFNFHRGTSRWQGCCCCRNCLRGFNAPRWTEEIARNQAIWAISELAVMAGDLRLRNMSARRYLHKTWRS